MTTVAETILKQLGGNRFIAMTGSNNFVRLTCGGLQMNLKPNMSKANRMVIKHNALDLYDIEFISVRGLKANVKKKFDNIYADQLREVFTEVTGFHTSL